MTTDARDEKTCVEPSGILDVIGLGHHPSPHVIRVMLAMHVSATPEKMFPDGVWDSDASERARKWLTVYGLINAKGVTPRGTIWARQIIETPIPPLPGEPSSVSRLVPIDTIQRIVKAGTECAEDLQAEIDAKYTGRDTYAVQRRRHERDSEPARDLLAAVELLRKACHA